MKNLLNKVKFNKILSKNTHYGLIWDGSFQEKSCVIKMIQLSTGTHYNQLKKKHYDKYGKSIYKPEIYNYNDEAPWYHREFHRRKSMSLENFLHEVTALKKLYKLNLGPKLYGYHISEKYDIHYGFIVMEKMDCSVKQILMDRKLVDWEKDVVEKTINKMHDNGIVHRDMKPSNIGVILDDNNYIKYCCILDCQKIRYKKYLKKNKFYKYIENDWIVYKRHYKDNRKKAKKLKKYH